MVNFRQLKVERSTSTAHRLSLYDGVCGNIHGHNMDWGIDVWVTMDKVGADNMPLDLKEVSGLVDRFDHALILSKDDDLLELDPTWNGAPNDSTFPIEFTSEVIGQVWVFEGDPTCEVLAEYVVKELMDLDMVADVIVTVNETEKYGITAEAMQIE